MPVWYGWVPVAPGPSRGCVGGVGQGCSQPKARVEEDPLPSNITQAAVGRCQVLAVC